MDYTVEIKGGRERYGDVHLVHASGGRVHVDGGLEWKARGRQGAGGGGGGWNSNRMKRGLAVLRWMDCPHFIV